MYLFYFDIFVTLSAEAHSVWRAIMSEDSLVIDAINEVVHESSKDILLLLTPDLVGNLWRWWRRLSLSMVIFHRGKAVQGFSCRSLQEELEFGIMFS
jgi:hypothetical protein